MTDIRAQLNQLRMSPRKVRLVVNAVKKQSVAAALDQLAAMPKRVASPLVKLINSAIANAERNFTLDREHLVIKSMTVDEGVKLKRYRPKGFGRPSPIEKKTSRICLVLEHRASSTEHQIEKPGTRSSVSGTQH